MPGPGCPCEDRHTKPAPMRKEPCSKVPGTNLTREEAAERARLVSVSSYEVELDFVGRDRHEAGAFGRLFAGQIGTGHFAARLLTHRRWFGVSILARTARSRHCGIGWKNILFARLK